MSIVTPFSPVQPLLIKPQTSIPVVNIPSNGGLWSSDNIPQRIRSFYMKFRGSSYQMMTYCNVEHVFLLTGSDFQIFIFISMIKKRYSNNAYLICDWHGMQHVGQDWLNSDILLAASFSHHLWLTQKESNVTPSNMRINWSVKGMNKHISGFLGLRQWVTLLLHLRVFLCVTSYTVYCVDGEIEFQSVWNIQMTDTVRVFQGVHASQQYYWNNKTIPVLVSDFLFTYST